MNNPDIQHDIDHRIDYFKHLRDVVEELPYLPGCKQTFVSSLGSLIMTFPYDPGLIGMTKNVLSSSGWTVTEEGDTLQSGDFVIGLDREDGGFHTELRVYFDPMVDGSVCVRKLVGYDPNPKPIYERVCKEGANEPIPS